MQKADTALWWIKRDLRLHDNDALNAALAQADQVLPVFVFESGLINQADCSAMHVYAWQQALHDLRANVSERGGVVYIAAGEVLDVFTDLHQRVGFSAIHSHQETGNDWTFKRDRAVAQWCANHHVNWQEHHQNAVIRRLVSRDNRQAIFRQRLIETLAVPAPDSIPVPAELVAECAEQEIPRYQQYFQSSHYQHVQFEQLQTVSETQAQDDLSSFLQSRGLGYSGGISSPNTAFEHGSRLSVHLAWGTLSLRTAFQATSAAQHKHRARKDENSSQWGKSLRAFSSRLHWHDHFIQRLESAPEMEFRALNPAYLNIQYEDDPEKLAAWAYGHTGFPMVDACMRCLQGSGFLNFRMRAMVVSFAVFGLHLSWRTIHPPLARIFLDYEPGIHLSQLQMQAGIVGINTIRVYSPTKQIIDQDPQCVFIKHWIPELADFDAADIINYEQTPLGEYPQPIVDFKAASKAMKDQLFAIRKSAEGKAASAEVLEKHVSRKKPSPRSASRQQRLF